MVEDDSWIKRLTNQTVNKAGSQPTNIFLLQSFHFLSVPDPSRALIPIVGRNDVDDMTTHLCHSSNKYHFDSLNNSHSDDSEWYSRSWQSLPKKIIVLCVMIVQFIIFIQFIISWHRWFHGSRCVQPVFFSPGRTGLPPCDATNPSGLGGRTRCGAEKGWIDPRRGPVERRKSWLRVPQIFLPQFLWLWQKNDHVIW